MLCWAPIVSLVKLSKYRLREHTIIIIGKHVANIFESNKKQTCSTPTSYTTDGWSCTCTFYTIYVISKQKKTFFYLFWTFLQHIQGTIESVLLQGANEASFISEVIAMNKNDCLAKSKLLPCVSYLVDKSLNPVT